MKKYDLWGKIPFDPNIIIIILCKPANRQKITMAMFAAGLEGYEEEKNMPNPRELISLLRGHKTYIQTHNFPDPDAIASAYGLQMLLKAFGIETKLCYDGSIDKLSTKRMLSLFDMDIVNVDDISDMQKTDYIVTIDGQKYNTNFTDLIGDEVACIDHHPTVIECEYQYKDVRIVGACASIVASYYKELNVPLSSSVASALAYGIKMDTADFTRGATDFDAQMFAYVFSNADVEKINSMYKNVMEFEDLKAYGAAIDNIKIYDRTGFAIIPFDCPDAMIAIISDFILALNVVDVSIVYAVRKDGLKFSVRSEVDNVDAGKLVFAALSGYGNGGGHKTMAGGFVPQEGRVRLGDNYPYVLQKLFLDQIKKMTV